MGLGRAAVVDKEGVQCGDLLATIVNLWSYAKINVMNHPVIMDNYLGKMPYNIK